MTPSILTGCFKLLSCIVFIMSMLLGMFIYACAWCFKIVIYVHCLLFLIWNHLKLKWFYLNEFINSTNILESLNLIRKLLPIIKFSSVPVCICIYIHQWMCEELMSFSPWWSYTYIIGVFWFIVQKVNRCYTWIFYWLHSGWLYAYDLIIN